MPTALVSPFALIKLDRLISSIFFSIDQEKAMKKSYKKNRSKSTQTNERITEKELRKKRRPRGKTDKGDKFELSVKKYVTKESAQENYNMGNLQLQTSTHNKQIIGNPKQESHPITTRFQILISLIPKLKEFQYYIEKHNFSLFHFNKL